MTMQVATNGSSTDTLSFTTLFCQYYGYSSLVTDKMLHAHITKFVPPIRRLFKAVEAMIDAQLSVDDYQFSRNRYCLYRCTEFPAPFFGGITS